MKKILFGTSALAAVALTAGSVNADAPTVSFNGKVSYAAVSYSNSMKDATKGDKRLTKDVKADNYKTELHWTATGTADNGLEYTGKVDWRYLENTVDEAWVKLGGGWGAVVIGMDDGVEDNVLDANSVAGGSWGMGGSYIDSYIGYINTNGSTAPSLTATGHSVDANKIAYYSPSFNGLSFSASLAPTNKRTNSASKGEAGTYKNQTELGLSYSGDMGGVSVNLGGAYVMGRKLNKVVETKAVRARAAVAAQPFIAAVAAVAAVPAVPARAAVAAAGGRPAVPAVAAVAAVPAVAAVVGQPAIAAAPAVAGTPASTKTTKYNKAKSYHVGGTIGMADFTVGAGYVNNGKSGVEKDSVADAGTAWNVGVGYSGIDKIYLSTVYTSSKIKTADAKDIKKSAGNDTKKAWTASVDYAVADGLTTFVEFANVKYKDGSEKKKNSGNIFLLGTTIAF